PGDGAVRAHGQGAAGADRAVFLVASPLPGPLPAPLRASLRFCAAPVPSREGCPAQRLRFPLAQAAPSPLAGEGRGEGEATSETTARQNCATCASADCPPGCAAVPALQCLCADAGPPPVRRRPPPPPAASARCAAACPTRTAGCRRGPAAGSPGRRWC